MMTLLDTYLVCLAREIARGGSLVDHYEEEALAECRTPADRARVARVAAGMF